MARLTADTKKQGERFHTGAEYAVITPSRLVIRTKCFGILRNGKKRFVVLQVKSR